MRHGVAYERDIEMFEWALECTCNMHIILDIRSSLQITIHDTWRWLTHTACRSPGGAVLLAEKVIRADRGVPSPKQAQYMGGCTSMHKPRYIDHVYKQEKNAWQRA